MARCRPLQLPSPVRESWLLLLGMLRTPLLRVSSTCQTDPPPPVAFESRALVQVASRASRPAALRVRGMAGAVKVQETGLRLNGNHRVHIAEIIY